MQLIKRLWFQGKGKRKLGGTVTLLRSFTLHDQMRSKLAKAVTARAA